MRHRLLCCLSGAIMLGLAACAAPRSASSPTFTYTPLKGDPRLTFSTTNEGLLIDIQSPTGIGAAEVAKTSGEWPARIVMRFHLRGLEELKFTYGQRMIEVHVASTSDHIVREQLVDAGQTMSLSPDSLYWMKVTLGEGYFDVEAPADFVQSGEAKFKIEWIDFYR